MAGNRPRQRHQNSRHLQNKEPPLTQVLLSTPVNEKLDLKQNQSPDEKRRADLWDQLRIAE